MKVSIFSISLTDCIFSSLKTKQKKEPRQSFSTQITKRSLLPSMKQDAKEKKSSTNLHRA
jgi:hypothetical protein